MSWFDLILLAIVQALTEFLPVSSSAHLYIVSRYSDAHSYQGVVFDLGLHLGTLAAILVYFRKEWRSLLQAGVSYHGGPLNSQQQQLLSLVCASIPVAALGLLISHYQLAEVLRNDRLIGCTLIIFGLLLYFAEVRQQRRVSEGFVPHQQFNFRQTMLVGLAQAVALIPGVSRSGITMTTAMLLGMNKDAAARFSFMLAVPATSLAVLKGLIDIGRGQAAVSPADFSIGVGLSFVLGLIVIHFFLGLMRSIGLLPFAVYRLALGLALLFAWI